MAKTITIACDAQGCKATHAVLDRADNYEGWVRRKVTDIAKRTLVTGVQEFDASVTFYFCPEHGQHLDELADSPPTHPEVLEWMHQPDAGDGSGAPKPDN